MAKLVTGIAVLSLSLASFGCAAQSDSSSDSQQEPVIASLDNPAAAAGGGNVITIRPKMVGGTVSSAAQDATVMLINGDGSCSGSLIAENLVLTARHCVAEPQESQTTDCVPYGATVAATNIQVKMGVGATFQGGQVVAQGQRIFVPTTSNMCSFDVALVQLDRPISGAKIAPVRFTPLQANEQTIAVGYGVDGNDNELSNRMQRSTNVLGVGPAQINYQTRQNTTLPYTLPEGDVATGESTCYGDSGGPLLDMQGRIVAITSRGIEDGGEQGHGNGCIDEPSIYAGIRFNEKMIRDAATAAGHPLPATDTTTPQNNPPKRTPGTSTSSGGGDDEDEDDGDDNKSSSSNSDDEEDAPKKLKKKSSSGAAAPQGCAVVPASNGAPSTMPIGLAIAAALVIARRRRSQ